MRAFCLHENLESHGFHLYEVNPDGRPSRAERIIQHVAPVCTIDRSELIDGRPASGGIIRPIVNPNERPQWPEAIWLLSHKRVSLAHLRPRPVSPWRRACMLWLPQFRVAQASGPSFPASRQK